MINRKLLSDLEKTLIKPTKKIVFLWGPRQTGKSTILNELRQKFGGAYFNFDDLNDQKLFVPERTKLLSAIKLRATGRRSRLVFIDEVQNHPESTRAIKLLTDTGDFIILATGSSELRAKTKQFDTLAGRYQEFVLFPLTLDELAVFKGNKLAFKNRLNFAETNHLSQFLEEMMIYGSYPGVILADNQLDELKNITQNSVVKDIVNIYDLKNTDLIYNLLRLLAMQIGNLVNVTKLASSLGSTKITISNYLSILSRNRIIFFLEPFKTNQRRAYLERKKVFFYDLGIRNALIEDFRPLELRQDLGAVFENLIIAGFLRQTFYRRNHNRLFFYREIGGRQKEIDLIIQTPAGRKTGLEIKYRDGKINRFPGLKIDRYGLIDKDRAPNYLI